MCSPLPHTPTCHSSFHTHPTQTYTPLTCQLATHPSQWSVRLAVYPHWLPHYTDDSTVQLYYCHRCSVTVATHPCSTTVWQLELYWFAPKTRSRYKLLNKSSFVLGWMHINYRNRDFEMEQNIIVLTFVSWITIYKLHKKTCWPLVQTMIVSIKINALREYFSFLFS